MKDCRMVGATINDAQTLAPGGGAMLAGRYRIVRQLGQGGMGSVWLAEDTLLDNKPFAIKMLPTILVSNKRAYRQLKDEALVAMKLTHPNIVYIRDFEANNGNPFLVMDYIDGQTLDDYLAEKGKLSEEEVIRVLRPIAAALDYAHGEGVIHRDVKPANVMIRKDGHPFILDFGIAREIQEMLTRITGKLSSGTLLYMSPEQLHGAQPQKDQDIYSFAAMAYECLSGKPPFSRGQIEYQIDHDMPEPLVGRVAPNAPLSIAASVMAGLAKKPEARPKTCLAVFEMRKAEPLNGNGGSRAPRTPSSSARRPIPSRLPVETKHETRAVKWGAVGVVAAFVLAAVGVGWKLYNDNLSKMPEGQGIKAPTASFVSSRPTAKSMESQPPDKQISELQAETEKLRQQMKEYKVEELKKQNERLLKSNDSYAKALANATNSLARVQADYAMAIRSISTLNAQLVKIKAEKDNAVLTLTKDPKARDDAFDKKVADLKKKRKDLDEHEDKLEEAEKKLKELLEKGQKKLDDEKEALIGKLKELDGKERDVAKRKMDLDQRENGLKQREKDVAEKESGLEEIYEKKKAEFEKEYEKLEQALRRRYDEQNRKLEQKYKVR